jgi:hypothetical protein
MARRENQGLQIAVILLVLFSVIMCVATYMLWSAKQKSDAALAAARSAQSESDQKFQSISIDNQRLKEMMGSDPSAPMVDIETAFTRDMELFGGTVAEEKRNYPFLPTFLMSEIRQRDENLKEERDRSAQLKTDMEALKTSTSAELAQVNAALAEKANQLIQETEKFNADRAALNQQMATMSQEYETDRDAWKEEKTKLETSVASLTKKNEQLATDIDILKSQMEKLVDQTMDHPDGEITYVNQQSKYAYVDLGSDDGLRKLTQFKVYGGDEHNIAEAKPKGTIEIIRVMGPHRAEALITQDDHTNPVRRGDLIFTPVWSAGNPMRFALAGFMDIDNDGVSDRALIKNIISLNGGVVDAEVTDDGKLEGEVTLRTTYLVLGDPPTEKAKPELVDAYSKISSQARDMGVKELAVQKLISDLNYRGSGTKTREATSIIRRRNVTSEQEGDTFERYRRPQGITRRPGA